MGDEFVLPAGVVMPRGVVFRLEAAMRPTPVYAPPPAPVPGSKPAIYIYTFWLGAEPSEEVKFAAQAEFHSKNRRGLRGADNPVPTYGGVVEGGKGVRML